MGCTTILVGKKASNDGSTMMARTDDSGHGNFEAKKFVVVSPQEQPRRYTSVISHVEIDLPDDPLSYTCFPNVDLSQGLWASAGINSAQVSITATETLTSNERVLAADPLVELVAQRGNEGEENYQPEKPGGIGEEDIITVVLPYIRTAREGVKRLGRLLEEYGTYEMNGIGIADVNEIWWLETIGGHHWMARKLPDNTYAVIANQLGLDSFDFEDAYSGGVEHLCSSDLREFIRENHLDLSLSQGQFNPREAFGSHTDSDHVYNTPRTWAAQRFLNPKSSNWDGENADYTPYSDDIAWCRVPEKKITMEDVKYVLSMHYQGTAYDPYSRHGQQRGMFRPIGINRTTSVGALQLRPELPSSSMGLHWVAFGSMPFNALVPFYAGVGQTPQYLANTTKRVTTESHYWENRVIAALVDAHYHECLPHVERYQEKVGALARGIIAQTDRKVAELLSGVDTAVLDESVRALLESANQEIAEMLQRETDDLLDKVLFDASLVMQNAFSRDDA